MPASIIVLVNPKRPPYAGKNLWRRTTAPNPTVTPTPTFLTIVFVIVYCNYLSYFVLSGSSYRYVVVYARTISYGPKNMLRSFNYQLSVTDIKLIVILILMHNDINHYEL